jgi:hypothetical protein
MLRQSIGKGRIQPPMLRIVVFASWLRSTALTAKLVKYPSKPAYD